MANVKTVNEYKILVPDSVDPDVLEIVEDNNGPGAYDYLLYRSQPIVTFEEGTFQDGFYTGPFGVDDEDGVIQEYPDLLSAMAKLDEMFKP